MSWNHWCRQGLTIEKMSRLENLSSISRLRKKQAFICFSDLNTPKMVTSSRFFIQTHLSLARNRSIRVDKFPVISISSIYNKLNLNFSA